MKKLSPLCEFSQLSEFNLLNQPNPVSPFRLLVPALLACVICVSPCFATPQIDNPNTEVVPTDLIDRIQALSQRAKAWSSKAPTERSTTELTEFIEQCESLLSMPLEKAGHREYLTTLQAWALDQRGVRQRRLGEQFRKAGNIGQADTDAEQAMQDFAAAISRNPKRWQTHMHRASVLVDEDQPKEAIADYSVVLSLNPANHKARFNRAELRYSLNEYKLALADYNLVLESNPEDMEASAVGPTAR